MTPVLPSEAAGTVLPFLTWSWESAKVSVCTGVAVVMGTIVSFFEVGQGTCGSVLTSSCKLGGSGAGNGCMFGGA